jgi:glycosyltransferase involved in cell wall biosynthesis
MLTAANISVIIPTFNRAELLPQAIQSVAAQTLRPEEIVVVDDGSTDGTVGVLAELAEQIDNLKVVRIEHTPLVGLVRNAGVEASSGSILAFLDSDDLWQPERLERQMAAWQIRPAAGLAFCNLRLFGEVGSRSNMVYLPADADYSGRILGDLLAEPLIVPSTMMVKREVFEKLGPFTAGPIVEDYEFVLAVAAAYDISYSPEILVLMREHTGARARSRIELANLEYLRIVGSFLRRHPGVSSYERAQARQGLANVHLKLARYYTEVGDISSARRHVAAMARLRPWDRRLPAAFTRYVLHRASPAASKS